MKATDIILNDDIEIVNNDLNIGLSDDQHVRHIILANPGQFYQYPDLGYGVKSRLNGTLNTTVEKQLIKQQIESDNYDISTDNISIDVTNGVFKVNGYIRKS